MLVMKQSHQHAQIQIMNLSSVFKESVAAFSKIHGSIHGTLQFTEICLSTKEGLN
jgi:hypothetical protein